MLAIIPALLGIAALFGGGAFLLAMFAEKETGITLQHLQEADQTEDGYIWKIWRWAPIGKAETFGYEILFETKVVDNRERAYSSESEAKTEAFAAIERLRVA